MKKHAFENPVLSKLFIPGSKGNDDDAAEKAAKAEVEYWVALLSYWPVAESILNKLDEHILSLEEEERPEALQRQDLRTMLDHYKNHSHSISKKQFNKWTEYCTSLAIEIRLADADRLWMQDAHDIACKTNINSSKYHDYVECVKKAYVKQREAKEYFARSNIGLVFNIAAKFKLGSPEDSIQEGFIGLIKAVERFDYTLGYKFSTYALWWIRHLIARSIANNCRTVRIPVNMVAKHRNVLKAITKFEIINGRKPTNEELSKETGFPLDVINFILTIHTGQSFSLDAPVGDENGTSHVDQLACIEDKDISDKLDDDKKYRQVEKLMKELTPIERNVLKLRFGLDASNELSLREIGDRYNLCRERIRQLEGQALRKLQVKLCPESTI